MASTALAAPWICTGPNTCQNGTLRYQVVVSDLGLFITETGDQTPLQVYNPGNLNLQSTHGMFLAFDSGKKSYDRLVIGTDEYPLRGGVNLQLGTLTAKIDATNPYVSISVQESSPGASVQGLLGFLGTSLIANVKGAELIALLEANNGLIQYEKTGLVKSYRITADGLSLGDQKIPPGSPLGLQIVEPERKNPCRSADAVIINAAERAQLQSLKNEPERAMALLRRLVERNRAPAFFQSLLVLTVDDKSVVGLDVVKASLQIVKLIRMADRKPGPLKIPICLAEELSVNKDH